MFLIAVMLWPDMARIWNPVDANCLAYNDFGISYTEIAVALTITRKKYE